MKSLASLELRKQLLIIVVLSAAPMVGILLIFSDFKHLTVTHGIVLIPAAFLSLIVAWFLIGRLILNPVNHLLEQILQIRNGEFHSLDSDISLPGELQIVSNALTDMVVTLLQKEKDKEEVYTILDTSPLVAFVWENSDGWPVEFVSKNILKEFGYHPDELLNGTIKFDRMVHPDDLERVGEEVTTFSSEKGRKTFVHKPYRIFTKAGEIRWVDDRTYIRRDQTGKITHYCGVLLDITDRVEASEALKRNANFISALLHAVPTPVFYKDHHGVYQGCNEAFSDFMGVTAVDIKGKGIDELWPDNRDGLYHQNDLELMKNPRHQVYESQIKDKDGRIRPVIYAKDVFFDEEGKVAGIVGSFLDISQVKASQKAAKKAHDFIKLVLDNIPIRVFWKDRNCIYLGCNRPFAEDAGLNSSDEIVGKTDFDLAFAEQANQFRQDDMEVMESGQSKLSIEEPQDRPDGSTRWVLINKVPMRDDIQNVIGVLGTYQDITEQVRLEEMMVQSEKMLSVGGLAAGMAHEINNPLAAMIQTANVMKLRLSQMEMVANVRAVECIGITMDDIKAFMEKREIFRMLEAITVSGRRIAEIVQNMLSFARKSNAVFSSHQPETLIDQIIELAATDYDLKKQYDFRSIHIIREYDENLPMVPCERAKIQQVLLNILKNGAQAMQKKHAKAPSTPCFNIRVGVDRDKKMLKIEIEDNGTGMDKQTQSRVFEPFFTTKPVGEGTGLGLSVSYFIITQNHGGTMEVESTLGVGATFIIGLPLERDRNKHEIRGLIRNNLSKSGESP